jgi:15-cis-phytoene synthase
MVNISNASELSAPAGLAISYAPVHLRKVFAWMLAFDSRMAGILERTREPMMAQMRFAWWREMLAKPVADRPTGEPLLAALAGAGHPGLVEAALLLVDAWEVQAADPDSGRGAELRAQAVFQTYAIWAGCPDEERRTAEMLGLCWVGARADGFTSPSRKLRPLSILALAARLERRGGRSNGFRLVWHALTGR